MALFEMVQTLILRFANMEKMDQFAKFKHANISNFTVYDPGFKVQVISVRLISEYVC